MKKLMTLIMAATLMGCYGTNGLHGDPTECEINCDDGDPCTEDVCDVEENCFHVPLSGCGEGCESHLDCDDADECTMDVCAFDGECVHDSICIEGLDIDGDGFSYPADCDDRRVDVHPGAEEICDDRDNDCDGEIDEDACDYFCPEIEYDYGLSIEEGQVGIELVQDYGYSYHEHGDDSLYGGCTPTWDGTPFIEPNGAYPMSFEISGTDFGLDPGDVIERLAVTQVMGETPIPSVWWEEIGKGAIMNVELRGTVLGHVSSDHLQLHQREDGTWVLEDYQVREDFHVHYIDFSLPLCEGYTGYIQLALMSLDDFVVSGKETVSMRTSTPMYGHQAMVLCEDRDHDGHDAEFCGGDDPDDSDPTII